MVPELRRRSSFSTRSAPSHTLVLALQVAAGLGHCLGVLGDGGVASWGWNSAGEHLSLVPALASLGSHCKEHGGPVNQAAAEKGRRLCAETAARLLCQPSLCDWVPGLGMGGWEMEERLPATRWQLATATSCASPAAHRGPAPPLQASWA